MSLKKLIIHVSDSSSWRQEKLVVTDEIIDVFYRLSTTLLNQYYSKLLMFACFKLNVLFNLQIIVMVLNDIFDFTIFGKFLCYQIIVDELLAKYFNNRLRQSLILFNNKL